jgi:glyoxylase-like metal-dependent hydrolase (beta-lactamase superfamily II)
MTLEVERITADNPGPMTLEGTNTYLVGRDPVTVIDPGPDDPAHIDAIRMAASDRGGIGTVLLTHDDADHLAGVEPLGIEPARPSDGEVVAGLTAVATPGHAAEHLSFLLPDPPRHQAGPDSARVRRRRSRGATRDAPEEPASYGCFCGDLILGEGSTIVGPRRLGGSLADYMDSLRKLQRLDLSVLYPGHGPRVDNPAAKIAEYIAHRQEREDRLVAALERGERSRAALLAEVWDDVPEQLLPAAAVAMEAHLEKLQDEGRLPSDLRD